MYLQLKHNIFSLIPGAGMANLIYLGIIIWILAIYLSNRRWGAFTTTLVVGLIFKGIDIFFFGESTGIAVHQFSHFIALPLLLTFLNGRISKLGE
ncbi:MAG: hypothetical protein ACTSXL_02240 [Alphaproteobacteria bacterium]